ncbi:hypothetical protein [Blastopirellula marina]|uniref:Carboxypeptidase regulatory-like domain-containing protein n=1 Tax=Blastopirellula marina DSM 3645 TaxID=314230 RepID=A3ZSF9_9BACT|nr:hypothetical protein [Blastopirellula marina]EAQ80619.1 hypothetical protein DSM3645_14775 [Blastopirellula marina DSM 3645]
MLRILPHAPLFSLLAVALALSMSGCGKVEGPPRYRVSGHVTFQGKPVPGGSIIFTPDTQKGNAGPQGTARIINGSYDTTEAGRGTVGGPHQVHVIATDSSLAEDAELVGPLAEHTFDIEFPQEATVQNLEIPKSKK